MKFIIEHLSKHFEHKEVLKDINFTFEEGRIYGLLGRNGAGKTTLFNCLNRDIKADSGSFCVYLGPTMMGVIQRGTIYRGGRKEVLDSLAPVIDQHPLIASLVVSDETLPTDRIKVKTPGNLLYVNYHKLAKGMK